MTSALDGWNWKPPAHWTRIEAIDMHTGGEPLRVFRISAPRVQVIAAPVRGFALC
jgi:proline racemase